MRISSHDRASCNDQKNDRLEAREIPDALGLPAKAIVLGRAPRSEARARQGCYSSSIFES